LTVCGRLIDRRRSGSIELTSMETVRRSFSSNPNTPLVRYPSAKPALCRQTTAASSAGPAAAYGPPDNVHNNGQDIRRVAYRAWQTIYIVRLHCKTTRSNTA